ncbi:energy transducer TonB [Polymorphum gilvum]|uniref:Protein TonB n=1 Tax=Polymorphum gilvum (strain LMG 25793 / CGMCC 1.9160 / SL003B-26A1) TaxID=991905 RepID=F2IYY1_POLGS|nr:energy transducer TonB [Polymorphum gilvum]ADZ70596.1 hypothetical protein SL003B_2171 [Polymorphum gilvum SL003B-26A1]
MNLSRLLAFGLVLSAGLHAAGSAVMNARDDGAQVEASLGGAVSVVGSLHDLVVGTDAEAVEPDAEPLQPVNEAVVAPLRPVETVRPMQGAAAVTPVQVTPVQAGVTDTVTVETAVEPTQATPLEASLEPPATATVVDQVPMQAMEPVRPPEAQAVPPAPTQKPVVAKTPPAREKPRTAPKPRGAETAARRGGERVTSADGGSNAIGRADASVGDQGLAATSNYKGKVLSRLRRAKQYPREASRAGISGVVVLRFTVARDGSVSGVAIAKSSGHPVFDQATLELMRRASPMPAFPPEIRSATLSFSVPVQYSSR